MLYAILIYAEEGVFERLEPECQEEALEKHQAIQAEYGAKGGLGAVARLMGTAAALTVRQQGGSPVVLDGPFAETKEQLLGLYILDCADIEEAIAAAKKFPLETAAYEIRPIRWSNHLGASYDE